MVYWSFALHFNGRWCCLWFQIFCRPNRMICMDSCNNQCSYSTDQFHWPINKNIHRDSLLCPMSSRLWSRLWNVPIRLHHPDVRYATNILKRFVTTTMFLKILRLKIMRIVVTTRKTCPQNCQKIQISMKKQLRCIMPRPYVNGAIVPMPPMAKPM